MSDPTYQTTEYRMCSGIRCAEYHELQRTGVCCGRHAEELPVGLVFTSDNAIKPTITKAMVDAARAAAFRYTHPGKKITDVAWVPPSIGLVRAMLDAAEKAKEIPNAD